MLKKRLWHNFFPVNFEKFLRASFLQNTYGGMFLWLTHSSKCSLLIPPENIKKTFFSKKSKVNIGKSWSEWKEGKHCKGTWAAELIKSGLIKPFGFLMFSGRSQGDIWKKWISFWNERKYYLEFVNSKVIHVNIYWYLVSPNCYSKAKKKQTKQNKIIFQM